MVATSKACEERWDLELSTEPSRESWKGECHTRRHGKREIMEWQSQGTQLKLTRPNLNISELFHMKSTHTFVYLNKTLAHCVDVCQLTVLKITNTGVVWPSASQVKTISFTHFIPNFTCPEHDNLSRISDINRSVTHNSGMKKEDPNWAPVTRPWHVWWVHSSPDTCSLRLLHGFLSQHSYRNTLAALCLCGELVPAQYKLTGTNTVQTHWYQHSTNSMVPTQYKLIGTNTVQTHWYQHSTLTGTSTVQTHWYQQSTN